MSGRMLRRHGRSYRGFPGGLEPFHGPLLGKGAHAGWQTVALHGVRRQGVVDIADPAALPSISSRQPRRCGTAWRLSILPSPSGQEFVAHSASCVAAATKKLPYLYHRVL